MSMRGIGYEDWHDYSGGAIVQGLTQWSKVCFNGAPVPAESSLGVSFMEVLVVLWCGLKLATRCFGPGDS